MSIKKELVKGMFVHEEINEQMVIVKKKAKIGNIDYHDFNVSYNGDYSTPKSLTDEIVSHMNIIEMGDYIDVSVGPDANFVCSLLECNKNINIYIADVSLVNLMLARKKIKDLFDYDIPDNQVILYHSTSIEKYKEGVGNMNFDGIVGNPPFGDKSNDSTYTNLWAQIYSDSFKRLKDKNSQMGMVKPKTWATPKDENRTSQTSDVFNIIAEHASHINIDDCKKHFIREGSNPGSTFSYTIISMNKSENCEVTTLDETFNVNPTIFCRNIIKDVNKTSLSIFEKFKKLSIKEKETRCSLKAKMITSEERDETNSEEFCYPVQFAMTTVKWANEPHRLQYEKKVIFPNQTTKNYPLYDAGRSAPANRGAVFLVDTDIEGENIVDFMKTKTMQFIISQQRFHHGLLNTAVVSSIPDLDYTKKWTDSDVYDLLNLEQEEIDYIEANVK